MSSPQLKFYTPHLNFIRHEYRTASEEATGFKTTYVTPNAVAVLYLTTAHPEISP